MTLILGQCQPRSQLDAYTGLVGEISIDSSNMDMRLHDGVSRGGHVLLNRNNADQRYQLANVELGGFAAIEPETVGLIVRVGVGEFRYRELQVAAGELTIEAANGYEGDPTLGLPSTITKALTFSADIIFSDSVTAPTFTGNLVGNVTGNLTGDVTGDVTGDLQGNTFGNHIGHVEGSLDARGKVVQLDAGAIPVAAIGGLDARIVEVGIPAGVIAMWSGLEASVPAGWFVCNGLNGTPDLRDRFIVGAGVGGGYAPGATGGGTTRTLALDTGAGGIHSHAISGTALSESSGVTLFTATDTVDDGGTASGILNAATLNDPGHDHVVNGITSDSVSHTHEVDLTFDVRPPYFALCFIMKG